MTAQQSFAQTSLTDLLSGQWKNCGSFGQNSKTVTLFKTYTDSCDGFGTCCAQSRWLFTKADTLKNLKIENTASCRDYKHTPLNCSGVTTDKIIWTLDDKKRILTLSYDKDKWTFKIMTLDKNKLVLNKT